MKIALLSIISIGLLLVSCNKSSKTTPLEGEWQLIEVLADPGDGSGVFTSVTSNKTIEFFSNGTISSNGELCFMSESGGTATSGTYDLVDSTIFAGCVSAGIPITFEQQGNILIVRYPCFEDCLHKYQKH